MIAAFEGTGRFKGDSAVVGDRRIERKRACRDVGHEQFEPGIGHDQRRLTRSSERSSAALRSRTTSIGVVVTPGAGWNTSAARTNRSRSLSTSFPFCSGGRCGARGAEHRAGAAGEIDDPHRGKPLERGRDIVEYGWITRAQIVGLAQREPVGGEAAHASRSRAPASLWRSFQTRFSVNG